MSLRRIRRAVLSSLAACSIGFTSASAATSSSQAFAVPAGWPKALQIPSIGVNASVESLALSGPADAHAPNKWEDVAWFNRGVKPGELGRAAIFGHLDSTCCPAVFYRLAQVKSGDLVHVIYRANKRLTFRVQWQTIYTNSELPAKWLFGRARERGLTLVTCAGLFHHDGIGYDHKRVLYARLVLPNGRLG